MKQIISFNSRIYQKLGIETARFEMKLGNGDRHVGHFAANPCSIDRLIPIILMPKDVLRDLPIALDWKGVQQVSELNLEFRSNLNHSVARLWNRRTLESKEQLRSWALSSQGAFGDLLDMIHGMDGKPYDFANDKLGEVVWRTIAETFSQRYPKKIEPPARNSQDELVRIVDAILEQFRFLVEDRDLWKELYTDRMEPRLEKSAQRFFYMSALSYCDANNINITPEADTGRGPVDFKFSNGSSAKCLVEIKLSKNSKVVQGYEKQLALYDKGERSSDSRYVIINVGGMGQKLERIQQIQTLRAQAGVKSSNVIVINGLPRASASHS